MGLLHLPNLNKGLVAHIYEDSELSLSLLSISDLCDAGCTATFSADGFVIRHIGAIIINDTKDTHDSLWHVKFTTMSAQANAFNNVYTLAPTQSSEDGDFIKFIHASLGSPALSILIRAVKANYLPSLSRLTCTLLAANPADHSDCTWPLRSSQIDTKFNKAICLVVHRYNR